MTLTLDQALPTWHRRSRLPDDPLWGQPVDLMRAEFVWDVAMMVRDEIGAPDRIVKDLDLGQVVALGDVICADIEAFTRPWTLDPDLGSQLIGALLIAATSACAGFRALHEGDIRQARRWALRPIVRPESDKWGEFIAPSRGSVFWRAEAGLPDGLVLPLATDWAELLFVFERFQGPIGEAGLVVFSELQPWLVARLPVEPALGHLALAAAEWSCRRDADDDDLQKAVLLFSESGAAAPEVHVAAAVHLAEVAERHGREPAVEARQTFDRYRGRLNGTQILRLIGLMAAKDPDATAEQFKVVASWVDRVIADWRSTTDGLQTMGDRRGAHFKLIGNFVEVLLSAGRPDLLGEVLGAWLEVDAGSRRRDLLYWFATETPGVGWAARQSVQVRSDVGAVGTYLQAFGQFTGSVFGVRDSNLFEMAEPTGRPGIPNPEYDAEFSGAALDVLALPELHEVIRDATMPPGAMVAVPYVGCPAQALLVRNAGRAWPWSVSLARPLPDSDLKTVRIVVTGTEFGHLEGQGLTGLFAQIASCELIEDAGLGRTEFLDLYHDDGPDVLWVIGHGEFDPGNPETSRLWMPDGSDVRAADLQPPMRTSSRRLLVLNVCEGGLAAATGGLPEIGLGVAAAGPTQAVIGHLWPILGWPDGPLFGRLLADGLARGDPYFDAYENAVRMLIVGPSVVGPVLDGRAGELDERLAEAVSGRHGERMAELAFWSSAAFLE